MTNCPASGLRVPLRLRELRHSASRGEVGRRYTIGLHGVWTPETARQRRRTNLSRVARGDNPAEEREPDHKAITVIANSAPSTWPISKRAPFSGKEDV